mgnify:CR=1 FL=1
MTVATLALLVGILVIPQACVAGAGGVGPHHGFLGGPWELVVQAGLEGKALRFPLEVTDESKPQKLDAVLPLMGTPITIKLDEYVPDLKWESKAVAKAGAGSVAKVVVEGKDLKQEIWLCSDDPMRKSITSSIGSVAVHYVGDEKAWAKMFEQFKRPGVVGILTVWEQEGERPVDFVIRPGQAISLPKSGQKVEVLQYVPHYSINTKTKEVVNRSDKPVNPAVKVRVSGGGSVAETWLWSKFQSSPHSKTKLPVQMKFTDTDLSGSDGTYVLFAVRGSDSWLLSSQDGQMRLAKAEMDKPYAFSQADYSFRIERIVHEAVLAEEWVNNSERLINPAFVVTIGQGEKTEQAVLELNKPHHYKTEGGTYVLVYRRVPTPVGHGNPGEGQ